MNAVVRLVIDDQVCELDLRRLMLSESMALEEGWGVKLVDFQQGVFSGNPTTRVIGAMVWLAKVRQAAAEQGVSFSKAAEQLPVAGFDVNLAAIQMEAVPEAENPTSPAIRTPATRTTRTTSSAKRKKAA